MYRNLFSITLLSCFLLIQFSRPRVHAVNRRSAKWFFGLRATRYVFQTSVTTKTLPSSCAVVASTLRTCRISRKLHLSPSATEKIAKTRAPDFVTENTIDTFAEQSFLFGSEYVPDERPGRANDPEPLSWVEYFGLGYVTVTKTQIITSRYYSPSTVFSYYVRGCRPTVLPFHLGLCNATFHPINTFSKEVHYAP